MSVFSSVCLETSKYIHKETDLLLYWGFLWCLLLTALQTLQNLCPDKMEKTIILLITESLILSHILLQNLTLSSNPNPLNEGGVFCSVWTIKCWVVKLHHVWVLLFFCQCCFPWLWGEPKEAQCDFHTVPRPPGPTKPKLLDTKRTKLDHNSETNICVCAYAFLIKLKEIRLNCLNILLSLIKIS